MYAERCNIPTKQGGVRMAKKTFVNTRTESVQNAWGKVKKIKNQYPCFYKILHTQNITRDGNKSWKGLL